MVLELLLLVLLLQVGCAVDAERVQAHTDQACVAAAGASESSSRLAAAAAAAAESLQRSSVPCCCSLPPR
jgi:hypothetical protein